jgi:lytic cellulose monooxygenase (C1-hydroxylating)
MTYIAPTASNGAGNVWIKLAEEGYANGKWAVDNLIANKGKHSITLPDLAAGEYLLRPEILALHEGMTLGGAQWYMECVQIKVTSAGTKTLPAGVAIPGTYSAEDAGVHFDIYNGFTSYPIPGPKVWDGASGSAPATSAAAASSSKAAVVSSAAPVVASSTKATVPAVTSAVVSPPAPAKTTFVTSIKAITKTVAPSAAPSATPAPATGGGSVAIYQQCGGNNYNGPTGCATGLVCNKWNDWYSQCLTPGTF